MFELVLISHEDDVDTVSDALMELDALSVSVEDADADTPAEQALFGEPGMPVPRKAGWQRSVAARAVPRRSGATDAATLLLAQDWAGDVHVQAIVEVPEQDWVRLTQSQFAPVEITESFWIVPSWHEAPPQARQIMRLDPGLAFGTGTHPTTRMCLRWIARHSDLAPDLAARAGLRLRLGHPGHRCGAVRRTDIDAVDIDPAAVTSSHANAGANGVRLNVGLPDAAKGTYPLVLANILATPLKLLAPLLCSHLDQGGHLVLAGILERQADELKAAYAPWLQLEVSDQEEGWILMTARRD
jgi:ribosomal protein L11 methyltransferase